jgi:hypothetical protein
MKSLLPHRVPSFRNLDLPLIIEEVGRDVNAEESRFVPLLEGRLLAVLGNGELPAGLIFQKPGEGEG